MDRLAANKAAVTGAAGSLTLGPQSAATAPGLGTGSGLQEDVATKVVKRTEVVKVACRIVVCPLEGLVDAASLAATLEQMAPLHIVLAAGSSQATAAAAAAVGAFCANVHAPSSIAEIVDLSSHTTTAALRVRNALYATLSFQRLGDYEVAYLDSGAQIDGPPRPAADKDAVVSGSGGAGAVTERHVYLGAYSGGDDGWGDAHPAAADVGADADVGHEPTLLHAGAVRLPALRKKLSNHGIESDFIENGLVTKGGIVIRRGAAVSTLAGGSGPAGSGIYHLNIEGPVCEHYFAVRHVLYGLYVLL